MVPNLCGDTLPLKSIGLPTHNKAIFLVTIEKKIKSRGESLQATDGHELNPQTKATNERSKCSSERSKCASITLPTLPQQQVVEQHHLCYQDQYQVIDGMLKPDYDQLEQ